MINIIETNISCNNKDKIEDFQSRVIKYESWDKFIKLFVDYNGESCGHCNGTMIGYVLPKLVKISNLEYDEKYLKCDMESYAGVKEKKLAYYISDKCNISYKININNKK